MANGSVGLERDEILSLARMFRKAYRVGIVGEGDFHYDKENHNPTYNFVKEFFKEYANKDVISLSRLCLYDVNAVRSIMYTSGEYDDDDGEILRIDSNVSNQYFDNLYPRGISNKELLYFCPNVLSREDLKWSLPKDIHLNSKCVYNFDVNYIPFEAYYLHIYMKGMKLTIEGMGTSTWEEIDAPEEVSSRLTGYILKQVNVSPETVSDLYIANYLCEHSEYKYTTRELANDELVVTVF